MHKKKNSFIQKEDFFVIEMYPQSIISTAMSKKIEPKLKANFIWRASREVQQNSTSEP